VTASKGGFKLRITFIAPDSGRCVDMREISGNSWLILMEWMPYSVDNIKKSKVCHQRISLEKKRKRLANATSSSKTCNFD
jgi:hypothetical protein